MIKEHIETREGDIIYTYKPQVSSSEILSCIRSKYIGELTHYMDQSEYMGKAIIGIDQMLSGYNSTPYVLPGSLIDHKCSFIARYISVPMLPPENLDELIEEHEHSYQGYIDSILSETSLDTTYQFTLHRNVHVRYTTSEKLPLDSDYLITVLSFRYNNPSFLAIATKVQIL